jgi:hypothetical protein
LIDGRPRRRPDFDPARKGFSRHIVAPPTRQIPAGSKEKKRSAIRRMLYPVVRWLIASGITFPTIHRMLKQLYVDAAEREFALPFKRLTDSRVSLVTGLHRKEVSQLRDRRKDSVELGAVEGTPVTRVLGRWMGDPAYLFPDGSPKPLIYKADDPEVTTFTALVCDLGPDVPPRSILDELLRLGLVELSADGIVTLLREVNIPAADADGKLTLLGSDPAEMFSTIVHNIERPQEPWLQRKVAYDNIGSDALPALRQEARQLGEEFIRRANALLASYDRDRNPAAPGGTRSRFVLGTYAFEEETEPASARRVDPEQPRPPGRIRRKS